ncbi:hypothetical protein G647_09924 [Cladophialophora carrionii CBS 160.54]|uniref:Uncharacterized protein n=1 Tax=Cladophialophora carrionii CBS 160.54 TaxID=1279043 RepID=V9DKK1_9EURO|nr:uncharacterized protein G647_09924 [Cladophialophora carrionii CBS 160.54]ETI27241.1 hypothetical protein G647_09924 [Cladophialophora carrionii CBS 160.54]
MNCREHAREQEFLPISDDCSPEETLHEYTTSSSYAAGEPGPAIDIDWDGPFSSEELDYFRSLPEQDLKAIYPYGIRPPENLGPHTPFDRYDQFHQALLNLAAGVSLRDVMRNGDFEIDGKQFVMHMAIFCVKSLGYTDQDRSTLDVHLSGLGYTAAASHDDGDHDDGTNISHSPSAEAFSDLPEDRDENQHEDVVEGTDNRQPQTGAVEQSDITPLIDQSVKPPEPSSSKHDPPNERLQKHDLPSNAVRLGTVALSTSFKFLLTAWLSASPFRILLKFSQTALSLGIYARMLTVDGKQKGRVVGPPLQTRGNKNMADAIITVGGGRIL